MKQQFHLVNDAVKQNAINFIRELPVDDKRPLVLDIKEMTRTTAQNRMLWSCLNDVSEQVVWYGQKLNSESWKNIFSASLKGQQTVPGIDGGFVVLGQSTSKMRVSEMRDLITLIHAFGAQRNVKFSDESSCAREWASRFGGDNAQ